MKRSGSLDLLLFTRSRRGEGGGGGGGGGDDGDALGRTGLVGCDASVSVPPGLLGGGWGGGGGLASSAVGPPPPAPAHGTGWMRRSGSLDLLSRHGDDDDEVETDDVCDEFCSTESSLSSLGCIDSGSGCARGGVVGPALGDALGGGGLGSLKKHFSVVGVSVVGEEGEVVPPGLPPKEVVEVEGPVVPPKDGGKCVLDPLQ
ncbi:hypothetical protein HDU67_009513 [Dinochytrium kinnereticum]|nr:hypothetical protein HDU67_009513 [Dinochytrium kinnereticum]